MTPDFTPLNAQPGADGVDRQHDDRLIALHQEYRRREATSGAADMVTVELFAGLRRNASIGGPTHMTGIAQKALQLEPTATISRS